MVYEEQIGHNAWHFRRKFATPLLPSISAHVCTASPPPRQNHRVKEYRADPHTSHKIEQKTVFLQIGQYGDQKMQNFMLIPNLKTKLRKKVQIKSYF
jgi:hypothetical protein